MKKKTVIAVDVDGVLGEQAVHLLARAKTEYGVDMTKADITSWNPQVGPCGFSDLIVEYLKDPGFVETMPVVEGAREGLALLRERARIIIATNTPKEGEAARIAWLNKNFGTGLEFVNTWGRGKGHVRADMLVDDYIPNIKDFVAGNHGSLGILFSQPWNRPYLRELADLVQDGRVHIAEDWNAVMQITDRMA